MTAPLPPELRHFRGDLMAAAARRAPARARAARRWRALVAAVVVSLGATSLAAATGVVPTPWESAPAAVVYDVSADGGAGAPVTCAEQARAAVCDARGEDPPLTQVVAELARRATATGRIRLVRLCRAPTACRTVPWRDARRPAADGELLWVTEVVLRTPPVEAPITAFTPEATRGAGPARSSLAVVGGPWAGPPVECRGAAAAAEPLCAAQRRLTRRGLLDVAALLEAAGARALVTASARACPLTGSRPCRALDPARARTLAAHPDRLSRGEAVMLQRQTLTRAFAAKLERPRTKPARRVERAAHGRSRVRRR